MNVALVINEKAKNAEDAKQYIHELRAQNISFDLFSLEPDALESCLKKIHNQYQIILIGGGDGSVRTAAQWCMGKDVTLGVLPIGTMNHFAKELDLPLTPEALVASLKAQQTMQIDVAEVNGQVFLNNASIGVYPKFAKLRDHYNKFYNKWLCYLPSIIACFKKHKMYSLRIQVEKKQFHVKTSFCLISSNLYTYQFPLSLKRETFQGAKLGLYYYKYGKLHFMKLFHALFNIKKNFKAVELAGPVVIQSDSPNKIQLALDGDTLSLNLPLKFTCHAQSLHVLRVEK